VTYRWIRPDNKELCWLHCRAKLSRYDNENLFEGVITDLTEELHTQFNSNNADSEQNLLDALPFAVGILDADLRLSQISEKLQQLNFGDHDFSSDHLQIGRHFLRCFKNTTLREQYRSALLAVARGQEKEQELAYSSAGKWIRIILRPIQNGDNPPGILISAVDRSESVQLIQEVDSLRDSKRIEIVTHALLGTITEKLKSIQNSLERAQEQSSPEKLKQDLSKKIIELAQLENTLRDLGSTLPPEISAPHNFSVLVANAIRKAPRIFDGGRQLALEISKSASIVGPTQLLRNLVTGFVEHGIELFTRTAPLAIRIELSHEHNQNYAACVISPKHGVNQFQQLTDEQLTPWDSIRSMASQAGGSINFNHADSSLKSVSLRLPAEPS
jgi:hypothetical protein